MAYISHNLKTIYIRVPKTGSTSITAAFADAAGDMEQLGGPHSDALDARSLTTKWDEYRKIGFIRHPLTWAPSFARWIRAVNRIMPTAVSEERDPTKFIHLIPTPMCWLTHPRTHEVMVDEVWRMEDIDELFKEWGVAPRHKHAAPTGKKIEWPVTPEYTEAIREVFARELLFYQGGTTDTPSILCS